MKRTFKLCRWMLAGLMLVNTFTILYAQDVKRVVREDIEWLDVWMPHSNDKGLPRVLLIGNSITRAYNREVDKLLDGKAYVARLATSKSIGDPGLIGEIELVMKYHSFDIVHFNNGMHGWRYTEEEYKEHFPAFFEVIRNYAPDAVFIWATTTPVRKGEGMKEFEETTERIRERNRIAADYFKDKNVRTNDLFGHVENHPEYYAGGDGVHLVAAGNTALAEKVAKEIEEAITWKSRQSYFDNFPQGYTPVEVGNRIAERFLPSKHMLHGGKWIHYAEVCTWYGALRYAQQTNDQQLIKQLKERFEPLFNEEKAYQPIMNHVDLNMFGCLPLEFYKVTGDKKYYELGMPYADTQWTVPADASEEEKAWAKKDYSWQTRLWIDDMFMITIIQSQAYKVTGDRKYIDRAAREMVMYLDELQRPNGLFYHAPDVPYFWARGDGWMAAGMAELLMHTPDDNPHKARILEGYRLMMKSLKEYQTSDGMWNQLIDKPDCWAETSGTAMFAYGMILGVKNGWLDAKEYGPAARKAWISLVQYINENNDLEEVCVGTNKKDDLQYYYDRPRVAGDYHGQAPVLWCAYALLK